MIGQEETEVTIPEGVSAGMEFDLEIESAEDEQQSPKAALRPAEERQRHCGLRRLRGLAAAEALAAASRWALGQPTAQAFEPEGGQG